MAFNFKEKIAKKGKEVKDPTEKEALKGLFEGMRDSAKGAMKEGFDGKMGKMKAVVSSDSKEGLEEGLEKAKEVVGQQALEMGEESECDEVVAEFQDKSPQEIDELISKLEELKASKL